MILPTDIPTIDSIYRTVNSHPHLAPKTIAGNPEKTPGAELGERARVVHDELYADQLRLDEVVPGSVDERTGAVTFGEAGPDRYWVVDEIARRVWLAGGRVLAVRRDDIPGRSPVAAIPRYTAAPS